MMEFACMSSFTAWDRFGMVPSLFLFLGSTAFAQGIPNPQAPPSVGTYCATGVASVTRRLERQMRAASRNQNQPPMPGITTLYEKCQPGDIIAINGEEIAGIGSMCDFTKSIIWSDNTVVCVFIGVRDGR